MPLNPALKARHAGTTPAGGPKDAALRALEQGADLLQTDAPLKGFDAYVVGFHCAKGEPDMQMEAHHFCKIVNNDLLQCVIFDGNTRDANLIGIEYIVSEALFETLEPEERPSWHPHNYEVLSGELVAPGLPIAVETAFMKRLVNSYGKTWHTWHSGGTDGMPLPVGDAKLMWSFNRESECREDLKQDRNAAMGIDTEQRRKARQPLVALAKPQHGVDTMRDDFSGTVPIPGVVDAADTAG